MTICIIEDADYKMRDLVEWAKKHYPDASITRAESFRSAAKVLKSHSFDIILLDMQLKLYDDLESGISSDKLATFGGERLLRQMQRSGRKAFVIMITQYTSFSEKLDEVTFSRLCDRLTQTCPDVFAGGVQYLLGSPQWGNDLLQLTNKK